MLVCGAAYFAVTMLPAVDPRWREIDRRPSHGRARTGARERALATRETLSMIDTSVRIGLLESPDDLDQLDHLFVSIWRPTDGRAPITAELMRALGHAGNYVAGAYDGVRPGRRVRRRSSAPRGDGDPALPHRGGAAARPAAASVGLRAQAAPARVGAEHGVGQITWTFDPLVRRNAYFNIAKLGALPDGVPAGLLRRDERRHQRRPGQRPAVRLLAGRRRRRRHPPARPPTGGRRRAARRGAGRRPVAGPRPTSRRRRARPGPGARRHRELAPRVAPRSPARGGRPSATCSAASSTAVPGSPASPAAAATSSTGRWLVKLTGVELTPGVACRWSRRSAPRSAPRPSGTCSWSARRDRRRRGLGRVRRDGRAALLLGVPRRRRRGDRAVPAARGCSPRRQLDRRDRRPSSLAPVRGHRMAKAALEMAVLDAAAPGRGPARSPTTSAPCASAAPPASRSGSWTPSRPCSTRSAATSTRATCGSSSRSSPAGTSSRSAPCASGSATSLLQVDANTAYTLRRRRAPRAGSTTSTCC